MTMDVAQDNPESIVGTITVFGKPARVLIDYMASRLFISTSFALHAD